MNSLKIVVLGDGGVGKSSITLRFVKGQFISYYDPTIEQSYNSEIELDHKKHTLVIIDTSGQEQFRTLQDSHLAQGDGFLVIYSLVDSPSFETVDEIFNRIEKFQDKKCQEIPIVLIGNKSDLPDRQVENDSGKSKAEEWKVSFFETSAKTGNFVHEAILACVSQILKKRDVDSIQKKKCLIL
ncbi:ras di-ras and rheb family members of small gtpase superfamily [Anaeramoeba ignava]|uniref:Ras di-ras and rheb family members of small gtpase superfamily n=1 Tax=Anaeramoeba ignava TaxID=1746090 RepID=A0A9Q0LXK8_ANAIG|nr:ras di-ras and rheb family members of small gtpase superfamily [Anaeramoeba ignava]